MNVETVLASATALALVASGVRLVQLAHPPPLTEAELESWRARHPLTPPPEREAVDHARLARWRGLTWGLAVALACWAFWRATSSPLNAYLYVAAGCAACLWAAAAAGLAGARVRGDFAARGDSRGGTRNEARRWEILDLYCERLSGEVATGVRSTRTDLARQAARVFRSQADLEFLRHLRSSSGSEAYRVAAGQILEDLLRGRT